ncbi:hypothetical protein KJ750_02770 [Patescibacteria group bacterium]|nr:hypothetical protein [Patescibacteria group bacterium]
MMQEEEKNLQTGAEEEKQEEGGNDDLPVLRTFRSDSAKYVKEKGISLIDVAASQSKQRTLLRDEKNGGSRKINFKTIILPIVAVLVLAGAGVGGFFIFKNLQKPETPVYVLPKPPIIADEEIETTLSGFQKLIEGPVKTNRLIYLPIIKQSEEPKRLVTVREFFNNFGITPASGLVGDFENNFMLSVFRSTQNWPILIFKVKSYDKTFAGMIRWERDMPADFKKIFPIETQSFKDLSFADKEIKNQDARVLYDEAGEPVLMYSFFNRNYLIITTSEDALKEIFRRFSLSQYLSR